MTLISPLISTALDSAAGDGVSRALSWQSGWRALTLGVSVMAVVWIIFEIGYYAGCQEERSYWAPLEAEPRKWPRVLRFMLRWERWFKNRQQARLTRRAEQERADALRHSGGRHRH